ncbi:hypothetical protein MAPG_04769 [Magnaporthiopsis poae ATCC 64411]|uniref:Extracellular matrix protein n=1 Tax=Magnaporthiopsis poae (strain ATCC 64411 / 73-15) TaxID=644358 RepID=A0A0C4DXL5_MAGP6|nr:hypothetical protein MAPG_04769 [Magnaporthiopsis poae ATCC 64411]
MWARAGAPRLLPALLLVLAAVVGLVSGQERALRFSNKDWDVTRGRPFTISWTGGSGGTASIFLFTKSLDKQSLALVDKLADTSEAQYTATLPLSLGLGEYTFGVNDGALYYSPFFQLDSHDQSLGSLATSANQTTSSNNSSTATPSNPTNTTGFLLQPTSPIQNTSSTTSPESTGASKEAHGSLSDGEKAGLAVGAAVFVLILAGVLGYLVRRVRKQTQLGVDDDDSRTIVVQDPRGGLMTAPRVPTNARGETRPPRRPGSVARSTHWARRIPSKDTLTPASLNTYELPADPLGSPTGHATPQASQSRLVSLREDSPATPSVRSGSIAELSAEPRSGD